jgi:DNA-binding winged helix-turn-helix (wHTH) protein/alpha-beta hydrolase superfamily lysophospholipase
LYLVSLDSGALCDHPDVGFAFDDGLVLDTARFELRRNGRPVPIEPQTFDVLSYLVSHRDRVVSKEELMDAVWGGRFVTEAAVTSRIKQARRAMGDDGRDQKLIRTVHSRGYRFVADVNVEATSEPTAASPDRAPAGETAPIRYTISDGLHIAYQVTGGGELDIVLISGFVSHLELDWADDRHTHFLDRLGSMGRLIRFDKRGTGMSDRPVGLPDLEMRMHDVLAVMDAVGSRRAVLCGYSEGGPMAILMAATHPERVSSLVLYGSYAKRTRGEGYPWAQTDKERRSYTDRLIDNWDWEADLRIRCPSGDPQMQRWWAQRMRAAATPSTIRALMDMNSAVDVRDVLGAVRVPTLVLHRTGDALFKVEEARYLADHIPGATLRLLEGSDHLVCGDPDQILDQIGAFLLTLRPPAPQPLSLTAVVAVAGESEMQVIDDLVATGGRARATPSGRRVALFDGPATAVRCGLASLRGRARLGVSIAEVARDSMLAEGPGVRHAERIADAAGAGELWVSAAAGMLLAGSGVRLLPVSSEDNIPEQQLLRAVR